MARRSTTKKDSIRVDLSDIGEMFKPDQDYHVRCVEATREEGQKAPYFKLKLIGADKDHATSTLYHNASTSSESLPRLRALLEAFDMEIPDGPVDLAAGDFVGKEAMCHTFLDTYQGGSNVKPSEFWPVEGGIAGGGEELDLDELSDEDIKTLAKALDIKGRVVSKLRKALEEVDEDDLMAAAEEWGIGVEEEAGEEAGEEVDLESLSDDDVRALAKELEIKGRVVAKLRKAIEDHDQDEVAEAIEELGLGSADEGEAKLTVEAIGEMSEEELEGLIEEHELDVELGDHKTLRKKRAAVVAALEEENLLEE